MNWYCVSPCADRHAQDRIPVSTAFDPTGMVKDENVCLLWPVRRTLPTGAWDMQRFFYSVTKAKS